MNFLANVSRKAASAAPLAGGFYGYGPLDVYGKNRAPTPLELVRECLNTVFACTSLNAGLVASTPLRLYVRRTKRKRKSWCIESGRTRPISKKAFRRLAKGVNSGRLLDGAEDVQEVTSHPALTLLNCAEGDSNENGVGLSRYTLFEITQMYLEIVGRAHWWVPRNGAGLPTAIWVLPSYLVQEIPDFSGEKVIDYYLYMAGSQQSRYETDEIISFRMPDLMTGGYFGGFSPTRAAFEQVRIFRQYEAHTNALLQNAGMPSAIFTPKGDVEGSTIGAPEARRLRQAIQQQFAMAGRGGIMVSEFPGSVTPLTFRPGEVVTPEMYKLQKNNVANCFQVPTTKLDRADSTLASAKTGDYAHAKDAGIPRLQANEAALNKFYLPMFEPDDDGEPQLFFAYDEPEGLHDESAELEKNKTFLSSNPLLVNELRSELGYEPLGVGGEVRYVPTTVYAVDGQTGVPVQSMLPPAGVMKQPQQQPEDEPAKPPVNKSVRRLEFAGVDER